MQYRSTIETFPVQLKERIRKFTGVPEQIQEEIQESPQKRRKRCEVCPRNMDRKTQLSCVKCKKQVCKTIVQLFANFAFHKLLFVFHAVNGVKSFSG
jgi:hypothetical protein